MLLIVVLLTLFGCSKSKFNYNKPYYEPFINNEKNVYLLRTHVCSEQFYKLWYKIVDEFPINRCFVIYDNTKESLDTEFHNKYKDNIILHTLDDCKKINKYHDSMWYTVESSLCIAYDHIKEKVEFEYMWVIENDIYTDGSLEKCFEIAEHIDDDYLATKIEDFNDNKEWAHWGELHGDMENLEFDKQVRSFFPVVRCSKKMLELLKENLGVSSGFCEVYFPTLAKNNGLKYSNLPVDMLGNFEYLETVRLSTLPTNNDNKLYHKFVYELFKNKK